MNNVILFILAMVIMVGVLYISIKPKKGRGGSDADEEYERIRQAMRDLEEKVGAMNDGKSGSSFDAALPSSALNIDKSAKFDLSTSLTDDELEILADDVRFYAEDAMGFNDMLKNIVFQLADEVDDGGIVDGTELGQLIDITSEMLEYPLYAVNYGRGTPERETILKKLKGYCK